MEAQTRTYPIHSRVLRSCTRWLLIAGISAAIPTHAFKVEDIEIGPFPKFIGDNIHERITAGALDDFSVALPSGQVLRFDVKATREVKAANHRTDSADWRKPEVHFDEEKFADAVARLARLATEIRDRSFAGEYPLARDLLGQALHTVQDFYAHTDFANRFPSGSDMVALPTLWRVGNPELSVAPPDSHTCVSTGLVTSSTSPLTSGYFTLPQLSPYLDLGWKTLPWRDASVVSGVALLGMGAAEWWIADYLLLFEPASWPKSKCVHGGDKGSGLNKDSPDRPFHWAARAYAKRASVDYMKHVQSLFKEKDYDLHLCQLMLAEGPCDLPRATWVEWTQPSAGSIVHAVEKQSVVLTATVRAMDGGSGFTGLVEFRTAAGLLCKVVPDGVSGRASCSFTATIGTFNAYVRYSGNLRYRDSSSRLVTIEVIAVENLPFKFEFMSDLSVVTYRQPGGPGFWFDYQYDLLLYSFTPKVRCWGAGCVSGRFQVMTTGYNVSMTQTKYYTGVSECAPPADISEVFQRNPEWIPVGTAFSTIGPYGPGYSGYTTQQVGLAGPDLYNFRVFNRDTAPSLCFSTGFRKTFDMQIRDTLRGRTFIQSYDIALPN